MPNEQWIPFCEVRPGPEWKQGYDFFSGYTNVHQGKGAVGHSMEGPYQAGLSVLDGPKQSSWTISIRKVGPPVQHYPIGVITWHCGRYGASSGLYAGNASLLGIEVEGNKYEPMTISQTAWLIKVLVWYWKRQSLGPPSRPEANQVYPNVAAPIIQDDELWEHREIVATDCPSGRVPWDVVIRGLTMPPEPTEWEFFTKALLHRLEYFHRVLTLAESLRITEYKLLASWRRSVAEKPVDVEVYSEVKALCQQMRGAVNDLETEIG